MPEHQQTQQSKKPDTTFQKQATPISQTPASNPFSIIQRARTTPKSLTHADVMQLQRTIGNRAVGRLLAGIGSSSTAQQGTVQRQEIPEEEEPLQGKMIGTVQRQEIPEEEEPLQGKFENKPDQMACPSCFAAPIVQRQEIPEKEEPLQVKMAETIQRQEIPEEEEPLQGKFESIQRQEIPEEEEPLQAMKENNTGMPDNLKAGVEKLSGIDMSDVRVHYNSSKPADVGALAYTQGINIHISPGQERHLPHEAGHVVQQAQGRVKPTMQMKSRLPVNDDEVLEHEADVLGARALVRGGHAEGGDMRWKVRTRPLASPTSLPAQCMRVMNQRTKIVRDEPDDYTLQWGERDVTAAAAAPATAHLLHAPAAAPATAAAAIPAPIGRDLTERWRHPLGFTDYQQFRKLTQSVARAYRKGTIIVRGSSVIGQSSDGSRPFRDVSYPLDRSVSKKDRRSDIDTAVIQQGLVGTKEVDSRGFAIDGTETQRLEREYEAGVLDEIGHPTGLKFFDRLPEGFYIVRSHTPESERGEEAPRGGRGGGRGGRSSN